MFKTWPIVKKSNSLYPTMVANDAVMKFGWHRMKIIGGWGWGGGSILKFPASCGPVLITISNWHIIFLICQITQKVIACILSRLPYFP